MQTGQVLDFYDDPTGMVLKTKLAYEQLPDFIKTAQHLDEAARERLPDDVFALIMVDQGQPFRKYACQDAGNTALSVIYFMENHHKLPEEAQKVAAANLIGACEQYGLEPPLQLHKLAVTGPILDILGGGIPSAAGYVAGKHEGHHMAERDQEPGKGGVGRVLRYAFLPGTIGYEAGKREGLREGKHAKKKESELTGSEIMPKSGPEKQAAGDEGMPDQSTQNPGREEPQKLGSARYVDVTGKSAPVRLVDQKVERYGLVKEGSARFPLDGYDQVKDAVTWFDDYHQNLHPADRHGFATKLAARANELDIKVSDLIKKYGSIDYAPSGEVNLAIHTRMQHWAEDSPERDMLTGLMGKYASVQPEVFCEALRQFDELHGLDREWDETIYDPWYSTYGFDKTAAEWVFSHAGERITSEQLRNFAKSERYCKIKHMFGDELADGLKKNPEKIFDSLPLDAKRIIMRMAADPQP